MRVVLKRRWTVGLQYFVAFDQGFEPIACYVEYGALAITTILEIRNYK